LEKKQLVPLSVLAVIISLNFGMDFVEGRRSKGLSLSKEKRKKEVLLEQKFMYFF
jgi:hypothetical protein